MSCCGENIEEPTCYVATCQQDIEVKNIMPSTSFLVDCTNTASNNQIKSLKNCIEGCVDCGCEEQGLCSCIPINSTIKLIPRITFNNSNYCESSDIYSVEYYLNGNLIGDYVSDYTGTLVNFTDNVNVTFENKGTYEIKQITTNCCGNTCEFKRTITVGPSVSIEQTECEQFNVINTRAYNNSPTIRISVENIKEEIVNTYLFNNWNQTKVENIPLPTDNVYIVKIQELDSNSDVILKEDKFVVYRFCDIIACYKNLLNNIICLDRENCPEPSNNLNEVINQFSLLASALYASADLLYGTTYGQLNYTEDILGTLKYQSELVKQLNKLCSDCGGFKNPSLLTTKGCGCG